MAEYNAKSTSSTQFELTQKDTLIGKLSLKSWFKFNALIEMADTRNYQVEPKGLWGTTIEIKENEEVLVKFKMNWSGEIVIQTYSKGVEKGYFLKHKGFLKESFLLTDQDGLELLVMKPHFKMFKMHYEYLIETADGFESLPGKNLLLMTSVHCANYFMSMATSGI